MPWRRLAAVVCCLPVACVASDGALAGGDAGSRDGALSVQALPMPGASCKTDADCVWPEPCLLSLCLDGECRTKPHPARLDCCSKGFNAACNDYNSCTTDTCGQHMPGGWKQCIHLPPDDPNCCDFYHLGSSTCDDGVYCTWDICNNGKCEHKIVADDCTCKTDWDCANKSCSSSSGPCTKAICGANPKSPLKTCKQMKIPNCCTDNPDCNDGLFCTQDICDLAKGGCIHKQLPASTCCDFSKQCDDGDPCTVGWCVNYTCYQHLPAVTPQCPKPPPPNQPPKCDDGKPCTYDFLISTGCVHPLVPECCPIANGIADTCDDGCGCTIDFCANGFCHHAPPTGGCCCSDDDCPTKWPDASPPCGDINPSTGMGTCKTILPG